MPRVYTNRRAHHEYELLDRFEAGIALTGSEVKSVRAGGVDFRDAFARLNNGNIELEGLYIPTYTEATYNNHEPRRPRRLLLHREEIGKLRRALEQKGLTLVPTKLYQKGRVFKVELALARGKKLHDKRRAEAEKVVRRELREL
ncbi:SsrA-binding protein, smpB [Deinococcus aerius]|uniref:SsrA-binding protein n=1 Tax=Deinococcus aerius TaxID=200253 RepID=A0A2I9CR37_9DEIO|nr:SsrA-binding protein SmpB [Deinococcus aerius]GBF03924.1 SsrA-binding protein, smpB [Deinococcus aerius]